MTYEQALEASKHDLKGVIKVLEGLEWGCEACEGTAIGVKKVEVKGKERHKWIDKGCPKCNGLGKLSYTWTPQVGEFYLLEGKVFLVKAKPY